MRLSSEFLTSLKQRNSINDVIGSYVTLKRAGSNYVGLCPFHNEKSPSFTVFPRSDSFYCFGCGAGGDIITFVMKAENLDYMSAVETLARRCGMSMPVGEDYMKENVRRKRIIEMNVAAAKFFRSCLDGGKYPAANEYVKKRGLGGLISKKFGLGYCPDGYGGALASHLRESGYTREEMKSAFLCGTTKDGRMWDYYRNRLIFPIIDIQGNVVAFGGRAIGNDKQKYLNTTDTPAFKKSRNLFSLNYAKNSPDEFFILCEGYMDVVSLYSAGFTSAVASLGTSLTQEQAMLLKKYKEKVVICYDGDEPGKKAAKRAINILTSAGLEIKVLTIPGGLDPDDYIKKFGAESFRKLLNSANGEFEYQCAEICSKYDMSDTEQKLRAAHEICLILSEISSDVRRGLYISEASKRLDIPAEHIKSDTDKIRRQNIKRAEHEANKEMLSTTAGYGDTVNPDKGKNVAAARAEEEVLGMILFEPVYLKRQVDGKIISEDDFSTSFNKRVFSEISTLYEEEGQADFSALGASFSAEEMGRITKMRVSRARLSNNSPSVFDENVRALRKITEEQNRVQTGTIDDILSIIKAKSRKDSEND